MKVAITGATGQLGQILTPLLKQNHQCLAFDQQTWDITNNEQSEAIIKAFSPDCLINLAAFTKVDLAETAQALATKINYLAVESLATLTNQYNIRFIQLSTNYVFAGSKFHYYPESAKTHPLNHYGFSKLQGEIATKFANPHATIIRTSSLYSAIEPNFCTQIINTLLNQQELTVINNEYTQPTACQDLATFIENIINYPKLKDIIHYSGNDTVSWYEFANLIAKQLKNYLPSLKTVINACNHWNSLAKRPQYALLDNQLRIKLFGDLDSTLQISTNATIKDYLKKRGLPITKELN